MNLRLPPSRFASSARLLQLASQSLPTGGFAYSGAMEAVLELGWAHDAASSFRFLSGLAQVTLGGLEIPLVVRMHDAWARGDERRARALSQQLLASREARELREQDGQMGRALRRVLVELCEFDGGATWAPLTYAESLSRAAHLFGLQREDSALVLAYSWLEQHAIAVARLLPLGPIASQKLMSALLDELDLVIEHGLEVKDEDIGASCPRLGMASAYHETQYTRIFRS